MSNSSVSDVSTDKKDVEEMTKSDFNPISTMGPEFNGPIDACPASHFDHPWLMAQLESFQYSDADGKWLMFFPRKRIDSRWEEAKKLFYSGDLEGISSVKVSTAMANSRFSASTEHVIAFFCGPSNNEDTVKQIGSQLAELFPPEADVLYYKSNAQTEEQQVSRPLKIKKYLYRINCTARKVATPLVTPTPPGLVESEDKLSDETPAGVRSQNKENHDSRSSSSSEADGLVIVLDTETTGFPPGSSPANTDAWTRCRMVELAWHVYSADGMLRSKEAHLIKPDYNFEIPAGAVKVHGITREKALKEGSDVKVVLEKFFHQLSGVAAIVGHNIQFDVKILLAEMHRAGLHDLVDIFQSIPTQCTMLMGASIMPEGKRPKLAVLYQQCFGRAPDGTMHRADADVEACAEMYFYLCRLEDRDEVTGFSGSAEEDLGSDVEGDSCSETYSESSGTDERDVQDFEAPPEDGNFFQTNAVLFTLTVAVASTAVLLYSFGR